MTSVLHSLVQGALHGGATIALTGPSVGRSVGLRGGTPSLGRLYIRTDVALFLLHQFIGWSFVEEHGLCLGRGDLFHLEVLI